MGPRNASPRRSSSPQSTLSSTVRPFTGCTERPGGWYGFEPARYGSLVLRGSMIKFSSLLILAVLVTLPFPEQPLALPVLLRLGSLAEPPRPCLCVSWAC